MKRKISLLTAALTLLVITSFAQSPLKEHKAGHIFYVSLPEYMNKTLGLSSAATIQYKSAVKDVYGFVIEDSKEDLVMAEMNFSSAKEFYENFVNDFLAEEQDRKVSAPVVSKKGDKTVVEGDLSYFDKEAGMAIYYLVGVVETKTTYYKVLGWCAASEKDKFKADFQKILYSVRD